MSLQAILFDVDGTLADTEKDGHLVAFNEVFKSEGLDWHWSNELYRELLQVTGGKERMKHYIEEYDPSFSVAGDLDQYIAKLHQLKTQRYVAIMHSGLIPLRNGVARIIQEARQEGIRLAISTTTSYENVTSLLTCTLGSESVAWFEVIAAGDIVQAKKPAPDIYQYALDKMDLKPENCLAIEDSGNGILSSLGANLPTLITTNDYTADHDFTGAKLVVDDFGEPDKAFTVIQGDAYGHQFVDIDLMKKLVK